MPHLPPPPLDLLAGAALFLDFDGTLVDLAETPDAIKVPDGLGNLLARLGERLGGRLAVVSGRALDDLRRHLPASGMALSGSHGLELRLPDGTALPVEPPAALDAIREKVRRFAGSHGALLVEDKPAGVALHFRRAPAAASDVAEFMEQLAQDADLKVQKGSMVVELRPHGADKGDAIRALMAQAPFAGARPVFIGDDLTDEHGFAATAEAGGAGILVGAERETSACYRLPSVAAVAEWLEASCAI